jgi:hypothetical protein
VLAALATSVAVAAPAAIDAAEDDAHTDSPAPPRVTRARLDTAVVPLGERDLRGVYRVHWHSVRSKVGGAVLEDRVEVWAVEQNGPRPPGPGGARLLSSTLDGEDVSEARRAEIAAQLESDDGAKGLDRRIADIIDLRIPGISHEDVYVFAERERRGDSCAARFEPADSSAVPDRVARGVLSWNCHTLEPVRLEAERVDKPLFVDSVVVQWDFEIIDGVALTLRYRVVVEAGLPFRKRRFDTTVAVEHFSAGEDPPSGPSRDTSGD